MVCVRPGVLLVRARLRRPRIALIALDLPTFERPAKAISGGPGGGKSAARAVARRKAAWAKTVMKAGNSNKIAPFAVRGWECGGWEWIAQRRSPLHWPWHSLARPP